MCLGYAPICLLFHVGGHCEGTSLDPGSILGLGLSGMQGPRSLEGLPQLCWHLRGGVRGLLVASVDGHDRQSGLLHAWPG